jgi:dihydrofolate reductase
VTASRPLRKLRYSVATSLDGFIAGPRGEYDWITPDPAFDFQAMFRGFDTMLIGRRTYEVMQTRGQSPKTMGLKAIVVSTTLDSKANPDVAIIREKLVEAVAALKAKLGKDIWLCGGATLFRAMVDANLVDGVELAVMPIFLGSGVNAIPEGRRVPLRLEKTESFPNGMLWVKYSVILPDSVN